MEGNQYWLIERKAYNAIVKEAREKAWEKHPKQRRRRFDAENGYIFESIAKKGDGITADDLTALNPVAIVYRNMVNLGTKKWGDYRKNYEAVYGRIEKETEASVKICGTWYRKEKIIAVVTQREVPEE